MKAEESPHFTSESWGAECPACTLETYANLQVLKESVISTVNGELQQNRNI